MRGTCEPAGRAPRTGSGQDAPSSLAARLDILALSPGSLIRQMSFSFTMRGWSPFRIARILQQARDDARMAPEKKIANNGGWCSMPEAGT